MTCNTCAFHLENYDKVRKHSCFSLHVYIGYGPFPVTVTTRIITFLVGNPYKPLFATITGKGPHPMYIRTAAADTPLSGRWPESPTSRRHSAPWNVRNVGWRFPVEGETGDPSYNYHGNPRETFIFRGYNPYIGGFKTFIFHGLLGSKGSWRLNQPTNGKYESKWKPSSNNGMKIKDISNHHLDKVATTPGPTLWKTHGFVNGLKPLGMNPRK